MQLLRLHKHLAIIGIIINVFCLFSVQTDCYAQSGYKSFLEERDLDLKATKAYHLYHYYIRHDLDSIKIAASELILSDEIEGHDYGKAMARRMLGAYLIRTGRIPLGMDLLDLSADYFLKAEDYDLASEIFNDIGHGYYLDGNFDEAMKAYYYSLRLGEDATDPTSAFNAKLGLARAGLATGDTIGAIHLFREYKDRSVELKKYEAAADGSALLANLYIDMGRSDEGLRILRESINFSERSESEIHKSHAFTNLGIYFFSSNERDSSLHYFKRALEIRQRLNNKKSLCEAYYNLGDLFRLTGEYAQANSHFNSSAKIAGSNGFLQDEIDALEGLLLIPEENQDHADRIAFRRRLDSLHEVLYNKAGIDETILGMALKMSDAPVVESQKSTGIMNYLMGALMVVLIILLTVSFRRLS